MHWHTTRFQIDLDRPRVVGIVNVTPDSFSDGGRFLSVAAALAQCEQLIGEGADMLDLGAESSRPGSPPLPLAHELARVLPVVREAIRLGVPISVDTYKSEVMRAVLDLGVDAINDIWALRRPGAIDAVSGHPDCGICLMHMHREPQTMQAAPMQGDVVVQVRDFLHDAAQALRTRGVSADRIVLDPGIGFGKTVEQNFRLLAEQRSLVSIGYPLLAGWSRKSSLGAVTDLPTERRMVPSVAAALLAVEQGARLVRVHDVADTVAALKIWNKTCDAATTAAAPDIRSTGSPLP